MIQVDTSAADRGLRQLAGGLEHAAHAAGMTQASRTADRIRGAVPVRSGRLRSTVRAERTPDGGQAHYGGGLPYAGYIENRSHAVAYATAHDDDDFHREMVTAAEREVSRL